MLALALRSGSLPVPIFVEEERTIGPLLGQDSIHSGIRATIYGSLFVVAFMIMYYWIGGMIASAFLAAPRCVMTPVGQPGLPRDLGVLQTVATHNRLDIPGLGPSSCVGIYAIVAQGGTVTRGDAVELR